jgi:MFS family permease
MVAQYVYVQIMSFATPAPCDETIAAAAAEGTTSHGCDAISWRAIFVLNIPVGGVAAWLAWRYVSESGNRSTPASLDWQGGVTAAFALGLLTYALTAASESSSLQVILAAGSGLLSLALFVLVQAKRGQSAMMPLTLFKTHTFTGLTILTFFLYAALGGLFVLLPFILIEVANFSALQAGAALLPLPLLIGIGSRAMGKFAARVGNRWPLTIGAAIVAAGFLLLVPVEGSTIHYWTDVLPGVLFISVGMAICVAPLTTAVIAGVDSGQVGTASGFNSAVARIGGLVATALLAVIFAEQASAKALMDSYRAAAGIGAFACAIAAVIAATFVRDSKAKAVIA